MREIDDKQLDLKCVFPKIPESCDRALMNAARSVQEDATMKKSYPVRRVVIIALVLICVSAAALAAYAPRLTELFGRLNGADFQAWLEEGDIALPEASVEVEGVVFTLDEVVYRDSGLYGYGTITPPEGVELVVQDAGVNDPWGVDMYHGAEVPEGTLTIAQKAAQDGSTLLHANVALVKIGVDGGELLTAIYGMDVLPQADGSWQYLFLIEDRMAVEPGDTYTIIMRAIVSGLTEEGIPDESSRQSVEWTVDMTPTPIQVSSEGMETHQEAVETQSEADTQIEAEEQAGPEIIVPEEYTQTGTLAVYRATIKDFGKLIQPELFNQSGIARQQEFDIIFNDGATLSWATEAMFYDEYDGTYTAVYQRAEDGSTFTETLNKPTMAGAAANLAGWMNFGWFGTGETYGLESTELSDITLDEAKERMEALMAAMGMEGYICNAAIDMSVQRIQEMGAKMNEAIDSGLLYSNGYRFDYTEATTADEGFYLQYHKFGTDSDGAALFNASAYVTRDSFAYVALREKYESGEVYETPDTLLSSQSILDALPNVLASARVPEQLVSVTRMQLTWYPMRAENKDDGMVLSPVWVVNYVTEETREQGYEEWAVFSAVDGRLVDAMF